MLAAALADTGRAALGQYSARGKQYLVLLRPMGDILVMEQLHYHGELKSAEEVPRPEVTIKDAELALARQLIEQAAGYSGAEDEGSCAAAAGSASAPAPSPSCEASTAGASGSGDGAEAASSVGVVGSTEGGTGFWRKWVPSAMISATSSSVSRQAVPLPMATTPTSCLPTRFLR